MTWAWAWACDGVRTPRGGDRAHLCIMMCWPCVRGRRAPLLSVPYVLKILKMPTRYGIKFGHHAHILISWFTISYFHKAVA